MPQGITTDHSARHDVGSVLRARCCVLAWTMTTFSTTGHCGMWQKPDPRFSGCRQLSVGLRDAAAYSPALRVSLEKVSGFPETRKHAPCSLS
jgi:hypothetical protein